MAGGAPARCRGWDSRGALPAGLGNRSFMPIVSDLGAALLHRRFPPLFTGVFRSRALPLRCGLRGGQRTGQRPRPVVYGPPARPDPGGGTASVCPLRRAPLDIRAAFGTVSLGRETPVDGRGADDVLGTCVQREGSYADRRGRAGVFGLEPDGVGAHRVRAVAVAAPQRAAEGAGVPGVRRAARCRWWAGAAGQAPGPRERFGHRCSPDGGGRAGPPAGGQRARRRAAGVRSSGCASPPSVCCSGS